MTMTTEERDAIRAELRDKAERRGAEPVETATCQNCDWIGYARSTGPIMGNIFERVTPGEIMPRGECPECGALARLDPTPTAGENTEHMLERLDGHGDWRPFSGPPFSSPEQARAWLDDAPRGSLASVEWRIWRIVTVTIIRKLGEPFTLPARPQAS